MKGPWPVPALPGPAFLRRSVLPRGNVWMKHRAALFCALLGACLWLAGPARAEDSTASAEAAAKPRVVVDVRSDRILLLDIAQVDQRITAVGERGFTMVSDDAGQTWQGLATPVNRTLTGVAFRDAKVGVAVGHGGSFVRTEDGGATWTQVTVDEAGPDSLLGVLHVAGDHFIAYGAFGLYFDSRDAGKSWQRGTVLSEEFDRHISQIISVGTSLLLVGESGTLAISSDEGATWTALTSPYEGSFFGALAVNDGSVLAFGMRGNVYRSLDLGATWQKVETGTTIAFMAGHQLADGRVMLVGNSGLIAESADGGQRFALHTAKPGKGFADFLQIPDGGIILAGEGGVTPLDPAWLKSR
jgi:photosystem II stability/assembly factor-like uncharacterized protein